MLMRSSIWRANINPIMAPMTIHIVVIKSITGIPFDDNLDNGVPFMTYIIISIINPMQYPIRIPASVVDG